MLINPRIRSGSFEIDHRSGEIWFKSYCPLAYRLGWIPRFAHSTGITWQGTPSERDLIIKSFDQAAPWGQTHHRPLFLGEFGTFLKADMASRQRWTEFVARQAESHGISWAYWEFCSGFGAFDPVNQTWRQPILHALIHEH